MRAAVYHGREDVRIEQVEERAIAPGSVRVAVEACGICGSDLHEYAEGPIAIPADHPHPLTGETLPLTMGHEFAGTVVETGGGVDDPEVGDAVVVNPIVACGECRYCTGGRYSLCDSLMNIGIHGGGGGFAERVVVSAENAVALPEGVSFEQGALVEPLSVGLHAVRRSGLAAGDTAAVFGAGPVGLGVLQAAAILAPAALGRLFPRGLLVSALLYMLLPSVYRRYFVQDTAEEPATGPDGTGSE